ncbi:MAG: hypothetical protein IT447_01520 [Phycisphaerales bacterium]|jgi:hypothetical protein|nr:hypothetical protein [Phycisphaerales bacterium]
MKKTNSKPYWKMNAKELNEATRKYDSELIPTTPLTAEMRKRLQEAKAKARAGRKPVGQGSKRVLITMERGLLQEADRLARQKGMSRSQLIADGLKTILTKSA